MKILIVTACDSSFMPFMAGMLASTAAIRGRPGVSVACFDTGLSAADQETLRAAGIRLAQPRAHLGVQAAEHAPALLSFLARPFLREYFPDFDVYVWIDSDVWLQSEAVFDRFVAGAQGSGMAIAHEMTRDYRFQPYLLAWTTKHFLLGYGIPKGLWLLSRPHVNAGFFAIHHDAPHWQAWATCYARAIARSGKLVPHDQFALNEALHGGAGKLQTCILPPPNNWICDRGIPMWNDGAQAFCEPRAPYRPLGALHLAGPAKRRAYRIRRTAGGFFQTCVLWGASPARPAAVPAGMAE